MRQQHLTLPDPAFCGALEAEGSDVTVVAGGGAGVVPGPFTPEPAGGPTGPEAEHRRILTKICSFSPSFMAARIPRNIKTHRRVRVHFQLRVFDQAPNFGAYPGSEFRIACCAGTIDFCTMIGPVG